MTIQVLQQIQSFRPLMLMIVRTLLEWKAQKHAMYSQWIPSWNGFIKPNMSGEECSLQLALLSGFLEDSFSSQLFALLEL